MRATKCSPICRHGIFAVFQQDVPRVRMRSGSLTVIADSILSNHCLNPRAAFAGCFFEIAKNRSKPVFKLRLPSK